MVQLAYRDSLIVLDENYIELHGNRFWSSKVRLFNGSTGYAVTTNFYRYLSNDEYAKSKQEDRGLIYGTLFFFILIAIVVIGGYLILVWFVPSLFSGSGGYWRKPSESVGKFREYMEQKRILKIQEEEEARKERDKNRDVSL